MTDFAPSPLRTIPAKDASQTDVSEDQHSVGRSEKASEKGQPPTERRSENVSKSEETSHEDEPPAERKPEDVPPNGGYGWVCVACCFFINCNTWGLNSSYGVFLAHYLDTDIFPGATRLDFAFVGGLSISQALMVSPIATSTTRLYGTRTTLLIGVFFELLSLIGASFSTQIWQLFLSQGVCFGWGMGFLFVGSVGIIPQWFTTRRSLANGIGAAGSGLGGLMYSLAANSMIQRISLGWAFRILGIVAFVATFICSILMKDRHAQIGSSHVAFEYRLFKRVEFLLLLFFGFLSMLGYIVLLFSLPNYASRIGLTPQQGSVVGAVLNLGQMLGRPPIGYFSDAMGRLNMACLMTFLAGLFTLVIWVFSESYGVLIFFALIGGSVAGTFWAIAAPVATEVIGLAKLPSALSIMWVVLVLPTTFSEAIALEITARNGGRYLGAQLFTGFMYIGAAAALWLVRVWKIGQLERIAAAAEKPLVLSLDPVTSQSPEAVETQQSASVKSSFASRLIKWQKV